MTGIVVFALSIAVVLLTSIFKSVEMSSKTKTLIAAVLSAVGAAVTDLATNGWDFGGYKSADVLGTAIVIFGTANLIYSFIMKGTTVDAKFEETSVLGRSGGGEGF